MFKITDTFVKDLLDDTKNGKVKWDFQNTWDVFNADYQGMKLMLEHNIIRSLRYNRLGLGVIKDDEVDLYDSVLRIDFDGSVASNPAYDLLAEIKKAAIAAKHGNDDLAA